MKLKIQATIGGYGGVGSEPITLAALRDPVTGVLAIAKKINMREKADAGYSFVTNMRLASYDCLFREEDITEAIRLYRESEANATLVLSDETARYRPRIEVDGMNESGQKFRLSNDMSNGEVAVLALVHFAERQRIINQTTDLTARISSLYQIISI